MPLKKLFSFIFFLLAFLIAEFSSSRASKAFVPSSILVPAGKSMDCSSSGTWANSLPAFNPVSRARSALAARRRCFFDLAVEEGISLCDGHKFAVTPRF